MHMLAKLSDFETIIFFGYNLASLSIVSALCLQCVVAIRIYRDACQYTIEVSVSEGLICETTCIWACV